MRAIFASVCSLLLGLGAAAPTQISNAPLRIEWRNLSTSYQEEYISAVRCLDTLPSKVGLNTSRYNDFPYIHSQLNMQIHFVAQFLPWHRYFVHIYETALRDECRYGGPMPYWDWTLDSDDMTKSPVFSADKSRGFGGNGLNGGLVSPARPNPLTMCVLDGAFSNFTVAYYDKNVRSHCLNRGFNHGVGGMGNYQGNLYSPSKVAGIIDGSKNFTTFTHDLENTPHGAIHQAVGGDLVPSTSPNDPIFFLHHTQIDRLWWIWQQQDPATRNADYAGIRILESGETDTNPATLDDLMPMLGLGPDKAVRDFMNTSSTLLNYRY